jgi:hypothetical protein
VVLDAGKMTKERPGRFLKHTSPGSAAR